MYRWSVLVALMIAFAGCTDTPGQENPGVGPTGSGEQETTQTAQPAAGNDVLYLHSRGSDLWMDTNPDATDSVIEETFLGEDVVYTFPLDPLPRQEMALDGSVSVSVNLDFTGPDTPSFDIQPAINMRLLVDGAQVSEEQDTGGSASLAAPATIPANTSLALEVCVCSGGPTDLPAGYTLATDGSSTVDLPVVRPVFVGELPNRGVEGARGAEVDESPVTTELGADGRWHARQSVTITNGVADASHMRASLATVNGQVSASSSGDPGYTLVASLDGKGSTEQEARENLEKIVVNHNDALEGESLTVSLIIDSTDSDPNKWNNKAASVEAHLPSSLSYDLSADTTNGQVSVSGLEGERIFADTTNGQIHVEGGFNNAELDTTNGGITAELRPSASGTISADTTNGGIEITVPSGGERGYDAMGDTTNGEVTIDLEDTESVGEQERDEKHVRTRDFNSKSIQTEIETDSTNGNIEIHH